MKLAAKALTKLKINSPVVCIVAGSAAVIGGAVMAHRAGRKVENVIDVNKKHLDNIRALKDAGEETTEDGEIVEYTEKDYKKDLTRAYAGCAWDFAKLYLPPIALTAGGILCFVKGHRIMGRRLAGMTAAYEAIDNAYKRYRNNVIEADGEEQDKRYLLGLDKCADVSYEDIDPETGEKVTIKNAKNKKIDVVKNVKLVASPYAVELEKTKGFTSDPNYNIMYLESLQKMANLKLNRRGYLFLSEVYEMLGVEEFITPEAAKASHCVGWMMGLGDSEVQFDMTLVPAKCGMKDGEVVEYKKIGLIDFNVCGSIIDKL